MILNANALHIPLKDETVQTVVTSPPYYGLRDYGTAKWKDGNPECDHQKKSRVGNNCATGHNQGEVVGIDFFRDVCGKCGAIRIDNQIGLEETPEAYVDKLVQVFREVRRVMKDDGTLWLNLGDSYAGYKTGSTGSNGLKPKDLFGIPWMVAFALRADGWYLRSEIIWHKPNPMPESVQDRPTKAHEQIFLLSKQVSYYYDADAIKEDSVDEESYTGRRPRGPKSIYLENGYPEGKTYPTRNRRSVWTVATKPYSGAHFATFPPKLIEPCILAGSREGDTVLDPFSGSGTTGKVALQFRREYVGLELNMDYIGLSKQRTTTDVMLPMMTTA